MLLVLMFSSIIRKTARLQILVQTLKANSRRRRDQPTFSYLIHDLRISAMPEGASHLTSLGEMKTLQILRITPRTKTAIHSLSLFSLRAELPRRKPR